MLVGSIVAEAGRLDSGEAERYLDRALGEVQASGADDAAIGTLLVHLAGACERNGHLERAEAHLRDAIGRFARACGDGDARTRHARQSLARVLRTAGNRAGALEILAMLVRESSGTWLLWLFVEELRRELGDAAGADQALDELHRCASFALGDPMKSSGGAIATAQRLAQRGRGPDAVALLARARERTKEVMSGGRRSIGARVPEQVLGEIERALDEMRERERAR